MVKTDDDGKKKFVPTCHICSKLGHIAPHCRKKKGKDGKGNNNQNSNKYNSDNNDTSELTMFCGYSSAIT